MPKNPIQLQKKGFGLHEFLTVYLLTQHNKSPSASSIEVRIDIPPSCYIGETRYN
jgi:hypothetical protein